MSEITSLEPRLVWEQFDAITRVPRPSKKEGKIIDFLVNFAKKHHIEYKKPRSVLKFKTDKQRSCLHATQKPVALLEYLIRTYTDEGDIVLDFAMGSGSTAVACRNTGRRFVGVEIDREIFQTALNRITHG